jgi:hypothetical protein
MLDKVEEAIRPEKLDALEAHKKTKTNKTTNIIQYVMDTTISKQT